jgi:hypothetical protein
MLVNHGAELYLRRHYWQERPSTTPPFSRIKATKIYSRSAAIRSGGAFGGHISEKEVDLIDATLKIPFASFCYRSKLEHRISASARTSDDELQIRGKTMTSINLTNDWDLRWICGCSASNT